MGDPINIPKGWRDPRVAERFKAELDAAAARRRARFRLELEAAAVQKRDVIRMKKLASEACEWAYQQRLARKVAGRG